ncbi:DNA2 [Mytilus edulis]|uniref:DNA2 n=1 Tax=Mytilus edulis TaxID=6550 RepID=A0A8S3UUD3_MYTED|nr:DNA2 [Mytilus edulis]
MPASEKKSRNGPLSCKKKSSTSEVQNQKSISSFFQPSKKNSATPSTSSLFSKVGQTSIGKLTLKKGSTRVAADYLNSGTDRPTGSCTEVIEGETSAAVKCLSTKEHCSSFKTETQADRMSSNQSNFTVVKTSLNQLKIDLNQGNKSNKFFQNEAIVIPETQVCLLESTPKVKGQADEGIIPDTPQSDKNDEPVKKKSFGRSFLSSGANVSENPYILKKEHLKKQLVSKARKGLISSSFKFNAYEKQDNDTEREINVQCEANTCIENEIEDSCSLQNKFSTHESGSQLSEKVTPTKVYQGKRSFLKRMSKCGSSPNSKRFVYSNFGANNGKDKLMSKNVREHMAGSRTVIKSTVDGNINDENQDVGYDQNFPSKPEENHSKEEKNLKEKHSHDIYNRIADQKENKDLFSQSNISKCLQNETGSSFSYQLSLIRKQKPVVSEMKVDEDDCLCAILNELDNDNKESSKMKSYQPPVMSLKKPRNSGLGKLSCKEKPEINESLEESLTEDDIKFLDKIDEKVHQKVNKEIQIREDMVSKHGMKTIETTFLKQNFVTKKRWKDRKLSNNQKTKESDSHSADDIIPTQSIVEILSQLGKDDIKEIGDIPIGGFSDQLEKEKLSKGLGTQAKEKDVMQPVCVKFGRHKVDRLDRHRNGNDLCLQLTDVFTKKQKTAYSQDFGLADTHVSENDIVNIVGSFDGDTYHITDNNGLIVVNPDLLLSGTTVVSSVFCMRKGVLSEKFKGCDKGNQQMLYGSIIHFVFQQVLQKGLTLEEQILKEATNIVQQARFLHDINIIQFLLLVAGIEQNPGPDQSNKKNLKIVHNNVCSLLPKLDLINNELHEYDIICISESHLDKSITDDQIKLNGFHKPIRLDRNRHGGGVTIYVKNSLHFIIQNDISVSNLELLWVEVRNYSNEKFLVGVLYRPPNSNSNIWDLFNESVDKALDCNLPIFLCGDFNCDMMSNTSNSFKKLLNRLNLENVVWEPTNFTTQTGTCIDLCVTNRKNLIKSVTVLTPICSSHSPVSVEISFKTFKQHSFKRQIRDFKRADYEGLKNQLNDTDWDDVVFNSNNINDVYMNFVRTFESTVNRYIPTKTITVRPNDKPFMNNLIRNKIRHRNRIHHKAKTSNNPDHWKKFREIRNEIISLVRKAKEDYKCKLTSQLIDKNIPPGKWWRIAKYKSNTTEGEVLEEIKKYIPQMKKWLDQYTNFASACSQKKEDLNITKVTDIEENIWCPRYGVKGKIDLTVEIQIKNKERYEKCIVPLELKTGRPSFSMEHKGQVTLYSIMSSDRRPDSGQGLLLYLRDLVQKVIPADHLNIRGLIQLRNEMAYYLSDQVSKSTTNDGQASYHIGRLPDPINNQRACLKCAQLTNCCIYQKSIEQRNLNSSMAKSKASTDKGGVSDLWCKTGHQREQEGSCIDGLRLSDHQVNNGYCLLTFSRHQDKQKLYSTSINMIGIAVQDYMIISTEKTNHLALCNGTVVGITEESIGIAIESESLQRIITLKEEIFRLDRYSSFSTASILYSNLSKLMMDEPRSDNLRKLIIDRKSPEFAAKLSKIEIEKGENSSDFFYLKFISSLKKLVGTNSF